MNRLLTLVNFLGVLALAGLCALQWRTNTALTQTADRLEQTRLEQSAKIAEQEKSLKSITADLDDTRQKLTKSESSLTDAQRKIVADATEKSQILAQRDQLTQQRDDLKTAVEKWTAAVSDRDHALNQANDQLQRAQNERNDAATKYNDLVTKYNQAVKDLSAKGKS